MSDAPTRHGLTQMSMKANLPPLRLIISDYVDEYDLDHDVLECGHTILSPRDRNGVATSAVRRRCRECGDRLNREANE